MKLPSVRQIGSWVPELLRTLPLTFSSWTADLFVGTFRLLIHKPFGWLQVPKDLWGYSPAAFLRGVDLARSLAVGG